METAQTVDEAGKPQKSASPLEAQNQRLQALVCELLEENETQRAENLSLRSRVSQLEQRAASAERGLANATRWSGALF